MDGNVVRRWAILLATLALALVLSGCGDNAGVSTGGGSASGPDATATPQVNAASAFPAPQEETFQNCPPEGDGGDTALNALKNRIDTAAWQPMTLADVLALTWPSGIQQQRRSTWSSGDAAQIAREEGRPVVIEGTLLMVRHEATESPNCHDQSQRDFHMWLAAAGDSRANSVIVEVTPRVRAHHASWQPDTQILGLTGHHVRISGWLLMDQEHPEQLHKTRGTLWEVHPVMKIEVEQNGQWTDLDGGTLQLHPMGGLHGNPGVGTTSSGRHTTIHRSSNSKRKRAHPSSRSRYEG